MSDVAKNEQITHCSTCNPVNGKHSAACWANDGAMTFEENNRLRKQLASARAEIAVLNGQLQLAYDRELYNKSELAGANATIVFLEHRLAMLRGRMSPTEYGLFG